MPIIIIPLFCQTAAVKVTTDIDHRKIEDSFQAKVTIDGADNIKGLNLKLFYDPEILECRNYSVGGISQYFKQYINKKDNSEGYVEYLGLVKDTDGISINNSEFFSLEFIIKKQDSGNENTYIKVDSAFGVFGDINANVIPVNVYNATLVINPPTAISDNKSNLPQKFELFQNYPNPFNPETTIKFSLPKNSKVKLVIYNILGQQITKLTDKDFQAGIHKLKWNGKNNSGIPVASGMYIYRIETKEFINAKKLILIR